VTFQVALIGNEGLVVGSDRRIVRCTYLQNQNPAFQFGEQDKFLKANDSSAICFFAGGSLSQNIASSIAANYGRKRRSILDWERALRTWANNNRTSETSLMSEQVIVVRQNNPESVWLITKQGNNPSSAHEITDHVCTGHNASARFLVAQLWARIMSLDKLKILALMVMAYASKEHPTTVGGSYDLLTLDIRQNAQWTHYQSLDSIFQAFQGKLKGAFDELGPVTASPA
jgi:hypothetical protein